MSDRTNLEITIDEGTYLLVTEILRHERNDRELGVDVAADAILAAVLRLKTNEQTGEHSYA